MNVIDAISARYSVRAYDSTPVPKSVLDKMLLSARLAPSAMNYQPWHFIIVTDNDKRVKMSKARYAGFLKEAPVVIVGCGDTKRAPKWHVVDVTIALQNMVMTATAEGLGTCWIGSFDEKLIRDMLKIPERWAIVALLAVGYPRKKFDLAGLIARSKSRKDMSSIVSHNEFGGAK
ncbi:MAG: nitroreductase family protein [Methanobacteriota archaeon]|nr:MAG: nitroreductase family protein [Euryarchaeota archaeon]